MTGDFPLFTVHWKTGHGVLVVPTIFQTPLVGYKVDSHSFIRLKPNGHLKLEKGYVWDFGSGPAVDTPDMVYASLAHDAFYELMVMGLIPWSERKAVDVYFKELLKEAGMGWARRQWVYAGVRWGYPALKFINKLRNKS